MSDQVDCNTEGNSRRPTRKNSGEGLKGELDPLSRYLRQISKYPLLDAEQEKTLGAKLSELASSLQQCDPRRIRMQSLQKSCGPRENCS